MFPYADYEFYIGTFHGTLGQAEFEKEVVDASFFLRSITVGKSDNYQPEELRFAACVIAEMYARIKNGPDEIKSENNDGYSVTYITERKDGESMEDFMSRKAIQIVRKYLLTTGLLNRKVGGCSADKCEPDYL